MRVMYLKWALKTAWIIWIMVKQESIFVRIDNSSTARQDGVQ